MKILRAIQFALLSFSCLVLSFSYAQDKKWEKTNGPYGTNWVYDIEIDPIDRNKLFVGTNRGMYRSYDGGENWQELMNGVSIDYEFKGVQIDPTNTQVVYAINRNTFYKSTDGGDSWQSKTITNEGLKPWLWLEMMVLALDPNETSTLFLGLKHPYEYSGGIFFVRQEIWQSTDYGENWQIIYSSEQDDFWITNITISPHNSKTIYVGTSSSYSSEAAHSGGILITYDGGNEWETLLLDEPLFKRSVFGITIDPSDSLTIYFGTTAQDDPYGFPGLCFKSNDGGKSWEQFLGRDLGGIERVKRIIIHPEHPNTLYVCGDRLFFRTDDGGKTFYLSSSNYFTAGVFPPNEGDYEIIFSDPPVVYSGGYGMYKSIDGGNNFTLINNGIESEITRSIKVDPFRPERVYSFTFTGYGNSYTHDGGQTWKRPETAILNQYGMLLEIDQTNPDIIYATSSTGLWRSKDSGMNWEWINSQFQNSHVHGLAVDPFDGNIIFVGVGRDDSNPSTQGMFKTLNGGKTWFNINNGFPDDVHVAEIRIDPTNSQTLYVATRGAQGLGAYDTPFIPGQGIYKSIDGGTNWYPTNQGLTNLSISAISINPQDTNILYATAASERFLRHEGGVFKSIDGGQNWFPVNNGLALQLYDDMPLHFHSLAIDAFHPDTVYAGVMDPDIHGYYRGTIFKTTNGGESWELFSDGLTRDGSSDTQAIEYIDIDPTGSVLYCATNAGVVYKLGSIPQTDTIPPVIIAGPALFEIAPTSITIKWNTHEKSTSIVKYGSSTDYEYSAFDSSFVLYHTVNIKGLNNSQPYHFRVGSIDSLGNGPNWSKDFTFSLSEDKHPPEFLSFTKLEDTYWQGPYKITTRVSDDFSVKRVLLKYTMEERKDFVEIEMDSLGAGLYEAEIPMQSDYGYIDYYVEAVDYANNSATEPRMAPYGTHSFRIFEPNKYYIPYFYITAGDGPAVRRINYIDGTVEDIHYSQGSGASWRGSICASQDGSILVRTCGNIAGVIDAQTGKLLGKIDVDVCNQTSKNHLGRAVISPDNRYAYSIKFCDNDIPERIAVINIENFLYEGDIVDEFNLKSITDLGITNDNLLYVVDTQKAESKIVVIDLDDRMTKNVILLGEYASGISFSDDEKYLFTLYSTVGKPFPKTYFVKIDRLTHSIADSVALSSTSVREHDSFVANRKNNAAYVLHNNSFYTVKLDSFDIIEVAGFNFGNYWTQDLAISEDDKSILLSYVGGTEVFTWETQSNSFLPAINIGVNPSEIAFVNVEVKNSPPSSFNLLTPTNGDTSTRDIDFRWESAYDSDENDHVLYDFHYATNENFSDQLDVENLSDTSLVLTDEFNQGNHYWWKVVAKDSRGAQTECNQSFVFYVGQTTSVDEISNDIPDNYFLDQNYPNPFNPTTTISFGVIRAGLIVLKLYNIKGQELQTLLNGYYQPGIYEITVDLSGFASGLYLYRIDAGKFRATRMLEFLK